MFHYLRLIFVALILTSCAARRPDPGFTRTFEVPVFEAPARDWAMTPVVKVCPDSPLSLEEVHVLLALWEQHGAPKFRARYDGCW